MHIKAPPPHTSLPAGASWMLTAYYEFNQLKHLYRQGWLRHNVPFERCESVAEHSLGVAFLTLFWLEARPGLDAHKLLLMALLHDFGEVYAGDVTPHDPVTPTDKQARELESVRRVLGKLPNGAFYVAVWEEFEQGESAEAQLVRQLDKLEMALQGSVYEHQGLLNPADFYATAATVIADPELRALLQEIQGLKPSTVSSG